ncbi:SGNH/GDSL hydrolase family protein [Ruegeria sp. R14_0]|uniref:SGNH/GDSL hydrolase family protein n=1 Tax=Ruegeria sp. R14_0 TaxID=2821100 RepID=UPI001ADC5DDF|nr:SGNH/GDSL hydrolase family protein [Ruegeria sp. R14_0]MBO9447729.1 SGNH/GDSL hydrolase family protein [Ruegeria sp. R14_0]
MPAPIAADQILRVPLLPVLAAQAISVRRNAQQLPEPLGPREGRKGRGPRLRLLITGDSSAAGVGAGRQQQALSGFLVERLARHYSVEWRLEATTGHTTQDTLERLQRLEGRFDAAVTALGVNDVTRAVTQQRFTLLQTQLLDQLTNALGVRRVVVTAVPQMDRFPALPQPLAWVLGRQAARLDQGLQQVAATFPEARHLSVTFPDDPALAAPDGYHPSPKAYRLWADAAADLIRQV